MQPEVKEKIEAINQVTKPKEVSEMSGPEQWDALAFKLIQQELAPKGYSEIKRGAYKGTVQSNIPFLPKKTVQRCQNLAAQCVRSYRERVRKAFVNRMEFATGREQQAVKDRDNCHFWQVRRKRAHQKIYEHYRDQSGLLQIIINELDKIGIK